MAAKRYGTLLSVGSDAHYHPIVGNFDYAISLLNEYDIPENQVINSSLKCLEDFLVSHHKR